MKNKIVQFLTIGLLSAVAVSTVNSVRAEDKKAKAEAKVEAKADVKTDKAIPFHGKLSAVDKSAKTISIVGKDKTRTFNVTSDTKIMKKGKASTLDEAMVGDEVGGAYRDVDGKLNLTSLRIGPKPEGKKKADAGAEVEVKTKKK